MRASASANLALMLLQTSSSKMQFALSAGDAPSDRFVADPDCFAVNPVKFQLFSYLAEGDGSIALWMRTAVDNKYFHYNSFLKFTFVRLPQERASRQMIMTVNILICFIITNSWLGSVVVTESAHGLETMPIANHGSTGQHRYAAHYGECSNRFITIRGRHLVKTKGRDTHEHLPGRRSQTSG